MLLVTDVKLETLRRRNTV